MTPDEVASGIADALAKQDLDAVRALTTDAGWTKVGGSVRAMAEASMRKPPPPLKSFGSVIEGDRAAAGLAMKAGPNVIGKLWVLCARQADDGFLAAGMAQHEAQAGLYLKGTLPAVWDWRDHGASESAEQWADGFIAALAASTRPDGPKSLLRPIGTLVAKGIDGGKVKGSHDLPLIGRAVVMFSLTAGDETRDLVGIVDTSGDAPQPITLAPQPSPGAFFAGMGWERDIPGEPEVARRRPRGR